jgi:hypothetical protein
MWLPRGATPLALALVVACTPARVAHPARPVTAFTDVTVVSGGRAVPHRTVIVDDDRVVSVGDAPPPEGARVIAGSGKYLVAGFFDMHVHLPETEAEIDRVLDLSLACGVTVIRGMQGKPSHLRARARAAASVAPELVLAGPPIADAMTPDQVRTLVRDQKRAGYDLIKLLGGIDRAAYDALVAEAAAQHIPVVGHVPADIGIDAALAAHQHTIEHVQGYVAASPADAGRAAPPEAVRGASATPADAGRAARSWINRVDALAPQTREAGVWNCPTLDFYTIVFGEHAHLAERDGLAHYATDAELAAWAKAIADRAEDPTRIAKATAIVAALHAAGAPLLVGSDTPDTYALPGFAYLDEMRALARAGLAPLDVLDAATASAAASLGRAGDGVVAPGARADLVLLDRDPAVSVDHLAHPAGVMVRGRWLDRAALDALLAPHRVR